MNNLDFGLDLRLVTKFCDDINRAGEEIMECDMEIEDDSPEASMMGEATPPMDPPIPATTVVVDEGQKVDQALPLPTSREGETKAEDEEPRPPGMDEDEPLPPGTEVSSGTKVSLGSAKSATQQETSGEQVFNWYRV